MNVEINSNGNKELVETLTERSISEFKSALENQRTGLIIAEKESGGFIAAPFGDSKHLFSMLEIVIPDILRKTAQISSDIYADTLLECFCISLHEKRKAGR